MENPKREAMLIIVDGLLRMCKQARRDLDLLESFDNSLPVSRVRHDLLDVFYGVNDLRDAVYEL